MDTKVIATLLPKEFVTQFTESFSPLKQVAQAMACLSEWAELCGGTTADPTSCKIEDFLKLSRDNLPQQVVEKWNQIQELVLAKFDGHFCCKHAVPLAFRGCPCG